VQLAVTHEIKEGTMKPRFGEKMILEGDEVYIYMGNVAKIMFWPLKILLFAN